MKHYLAKKYGIPPSTLHRHARMESCIGAGCPTVLTPEEERGCLFMPGIAGDGFRNDQRNGRCHFC